MNDKVNSQKHLGKEVSEVLRRIESLFRQKNEQYRTGEDDLANFTAGALLLGHNADEVGRFEALKSYVAKHIAMVYNSKLSDDKVDESIMDIAVYFVIATVMYKRLKDNACNLSKSHSVGKWIFNACDGTNNFGEVECSICHHHITHIFKECFQEKQAYKQCPICESVMEGFE